MEKGDEKKTALEVPVQEQFNKNFENGSKIELEFSLKLHQFNKNDLLKILTYFAQCSHKFYLSIAKKLK
ncbi:hypothetical protein FDC27_14980 [Clostridium botulinum]|nr:hypothetical protein [Clostridium botulinum]NFO68221.1 hypothetical protein [Clostridium botulinum]